MTVPKRMRMFAGPNGSGKTTLVRKLSNDFTPSGFFHLNHYINADDLLRSLLDGHGVAFCDFGLTCTAEQIRTELIANTRVDAQHPFLKLMQMTGSVITAPPEACDSYVAAALADLLREALLATGESFSFETVMSHPSKIEILRRARSLDYRTYLYFIATSTPSLNVSRVGFRTGLGGHAVPENKIRERYERALQLVGDALSFAYRAYFFDNSGSEPVLLAELKPDGKIELQVHRDRLPHWFSTHVLSR